MNTQQAESIEQVALRKAKAEADLADAELIEWHSVSARVAREAERRAAASKSAREQLPDFSTVDRGSLTSPESGTLFGSVLGLQALRGAAGSVVREVLEATAAWKHEDGTERPKNRHFVITTDGQLATSDGAYTEVRWAVGELLAATRACQGSSSQPGGRSLGAVGAAASLLPAVLSLASSRRALTGETMPVDTAAAAASVAAILAVGDDCSVWHDDVRVLDPLAESPLRTDLDEMKSERTRLADIGTDEAIALIARVDDLISTLAEVPEGAARSLLVTALLRERLHVDKEGVKVWLIWVQGCTGSAAQVIDDRPLMLRDKVSTIASLGLTYLLVEATTGQVRGGGTLVQTCCLSGSIGSDFKLGRIDGSALDEIRLRPAAGKAAPSGISPAAAGAGTEVALVEPGTVPRANWLRRISGRRRGSIENAGA